MTVSGKRVLPAVLGILTLASIVVSALPSQKAYAGQITSRSLTLETGTDGNSDGIPDGGSMPSGHVKHLFTFTIPSNSAIGSIQFKYCTKARDSSCVTPTGLDTTGAALGTTDGVVFNDIINTTNGAPVVTRSSAAPGQTNTLTHLELTGVVNPSTINTAFYVDITTYASEDGTGSPIDEGWVAGATSNQIQLSGTMPESLIFCTAEHIDLASGIPDCSTATDDAVTFNQLFSPSDTAWALSQMAASTNAANGYAITVTGPTLTSGSNTITPMDDGSGGATTSVRGTSQFGLNLKLNDGSAYANAPNVTDSAEITPASNGNNLRGAPATNYDTAGSFKFSTSGDTVATASTGTDMQLYTVSYIVNVNGAQLAGTYTSTLTYICTATF